MSCSSIPFAELNKKLQHQQELITKLETELTSLSTTHNTSNWRLIIKTYLSDIRDNIEALGNRETELKNNNLILKNKVFHLQKEINDLTIARRKLSPHKSPTHIPQPIPTHTHPTQQTIAPFRPKPIDLNSISIHSPYTHIQPASPIPIEKMIGSPDIFAHKNWMFESLKNAMADSNQMDRMSKVLGIKTLPEMVFPNSYLKISLPNSIEIKLDAINGLKPCIGEPNKQRRVEVQYAKEWKGKAKQRSDVQRLKCNYDWTFTSNYFGDYKSLKMDKKELRVAQNVKDRFNMLMLRDTSLPILWSSHCVLFEDELSDNGMSQLLVRCRVMNDGWLVLMRYWLRVDNVIVRINDTRLFHEFGKGFVLRHYQEKESKWEKLTKKHPMIHLMDFNDPNEFADKIDIMNSVYDKIYL